ncbi:hypothetical protein AYO38_00720 [bacterium SCGC AG-212-C10]|nr:hypothetical protein AYO38_00720 [bacterium SCGC AG-212-C10]
MVFGLIGDTHGYFGDDIAEALAGCDQILHAGDVGEGVLAHLRPIAPVTAVSGNNDVSGEASMLPPLAWVQAEGRAIAVVHRLIDAPAEGWDLLVFGHCHKQHADAVDGRMLLNPGAAGRRGFHTVRSVARLQLLAGEPPACTFVDLGPRRAAR